MAIEQPYYNPELWGGIECTINRTQDSFRDQLLATGHYTRPGDIEEFAKLGIRKLRYPVLWELHQPCKNDPIDWSYTEQQLNTIREHNIEPIAGLLHHGSGPAHTNLADKDFPSLLASYAAAVAKKFPWLQYYTPVNEPLTTARFSGLYGHWYPHYQDETSFFRMLLHQVKGIVLSMQAIRTINPQAKLVQTEDLSKTHSTSLLSYQALFENNRRWLTYDFLCGKVDEEHYLYDYIISLGFSKEELYFFVENPCPPAIMGFNYYVTSERYLDERTENYPNITPGGNGKHVYVDTEAVRCTDTCGLEGLLKEAWERYQLPLAITECHLNCTREEQLRWFKETWDTVLRVKDKGIDIKAITAWSLLGAYDWNSLLTKVNNHYEPGVFDIRNHARRPTALSKLIRSLAETGDYSHPLLFEKGWWNKKQDDRVKSIHQPQPLLITGCNGTLGQAFMRICKRRSIPYIALSRNELDISNEKEVYAIMNTHKPWAVINAAGYVNVDRAETDQERCFAANAAGPGLLAKACHVYGARLLTFSSDLVFDGGKKCPYYEKDMVNPLNIYGMSKAQGEERVMNTGTDALIIRTSAFFGPWDKYNFVYSILHSLDTDQRITVTNDVLVSPTYVPDLADAAMDLFIDEEKGIWHISNDGILSWADFAGIVAERSGYKRNKLNIKSLPEMGWKAKRPVYSGLQSEKGIKLPQLEDALARYFEERIT